MRIIYNNTLETATLTTNSENANYLVENVYDTRLSRWYKSTDKDQQWVQVYNDDGITASYVAIAEHNVSSTATIKIQGTDNVDSNDDPVWNDFEENITYDSDIMILNFTEATYDYWRVYIDDPLNSDNFIRIGMIYLSGYLQCPGMKPDQEITDNTTASSTISGSGQAYGDDGYNFRSNKINFNFTSKARRETFRTVFSTMKNYRPVILLIWEGDLTIESPIYCILDTNKLTNKRTDSLLFPWQFSVQYREVF